MLLLRLAVWEAFNWRWLGNLHEVLSRVELGLVGAFRLRLPKVTRHCLPAILLLSAGLVLVGGLVVHVGHGRLMLGEGYFGGLYFKLL